MGEGRTKRRDEVKLESGKLVGYRLPWLSDAILAGGLPMGTVDKITAALAGNEVKAEQARIDLDAIESGRRYHDRLVMDMVLDVDGADVRITERDELRDWFSEDEYLELVKIAKREKDPDSGEA